MKENVMIKSAACLHIILLFILILSCKSMPKYDISVGTIDESNNYSLRNIRLKLPSGWKFNEEIRNELIRARKVAGRIGSETTSFMDETILDCILLEKGNEAGIFIWIHKMNPRYSENDLKQQFPLMAREILKDLRSKQKEAKKANQVSCTNDSHPYLSEMSTTCELPAAKRKITVVAKYLPFKITAHVIWFMFSHRSTNKNTQNIKEFEALVQSVHLSNE